MKGKPSGYNGLAKGEALHRNHCRIMKSIMRQTAPRTPAGKRVGRKVLTLIHRYGRLQCRAISEASSTPKERLQHRVVYAATASRGRSRPSVAIPGAPAAPSFYTNGLHHNDGVRQRPWWTTNTVDSATKPSLILEPSDATGIQCGRENYIPQEQ